MVYYNDLYSPFILTKLEGDLLKSSYPYPHSLTQSQRMGINI